MNTIKVDKERPIFFGVYSIRLYAKEKGVEFDDALNSLDKMNTEDIMKLVYCGFLYGAKKQGIDIDFTEEDVWFWVDEQPNILPEIMTVFNQSMPQSKNPKAPQKGGK